MKTLSNGEHLTSAQVAGYLDRGLSEQDRNLVQQHLSSCPACRRELLEVNRVLRKRRPNWLAAGGLAAAAAITALILASPGAEQANRSVLRSGRDTALTGTLLEISVLEPRDSQIPASERLKFQWEPLGTDVLYRFTLTRQDGSVLWNQDTPGTEVVLPDSVNLKPGGRYFWYVDGLTPDGRMARTGMRTVRIEP